MDLMLLNFILHNFITANVNAIVFFQCWSLETQHHFLHVFNQQMWFTRFVNIGSIDLSDGFEYRYLLHSRSILGAYLDMNCKRSENVMNTLSRWSLYNGHYNWLLYDRTADMSNFRRLFVNANMSIDAELTYATLVPALPDPHTTANITSYITYDVYNNGHILGGKLNVTIDREIQCNLEDCFVRRYLSDLHLRHKYDNRAKMEDITLRVSTVVTTRPLSLPASSLLDFLITDNNPEVDPIARLGYRLLLIFQDFFGCKMVHTFRDRWSGNETHGGIIGDLIAKKADFGSTAFTGSEKRMRHLSIIAETGGFLQVCLFRTPRSSSVRGEAFVQPFDNTVWLLFSILLVLVAIFLWRTFALEARNFEDHMPYEPSLIATFLLAFGSACYQGSNIVPFSMGGRLALFSLYFVTFIVYNYYTSVLLSTLLGPPLKSDLKSLGQIADSPLEVGFEPLVYTHLYFNISQLPEVRRFVERKITSKPHPDKVWIPMEEGVLRVRDEPGFVFVLETSTSYSFLERNFEPHEICDLNEVMLRPDRGLLNHLPKNSTYKEVTRLRASRMLETGVYRRHRRYWVKDKLNCELSNYLFAVGMEYTAPLFLLLLFAFIFCLLLLGLECVVKRLSDYQQSQSQMEF